MRPPLQPLPIRVAQRRAPLCMSLFSPSGSLDSHTATRRMAVHIPLALEHVFCGAIVPRAVVRVARLSTAPARRHPHRGLVTKREAAKLESCSSSRKRALPGALSKDLEKSFGRPDCVSVGDHGGSRERHRSRAPPGCEAISHGVPLSLQNLKLLRPAQGFLCCWLRIGPPSLHVLCPYVCAAHSPRRRRLGWERQNAGRKANSNRLCIYFAAGRLGAGVRGGSCVPLGFRLSCSGESRGAVVQRWGGPAGHGKPGPYQPVYAGCPAMEGSRARQHAGFAPGLVFSLPQSFLSQAPPEGASQKCIRGDYDEPSHLFAASPQHKGARLLCVRSLKGLWAPGS